MSPESQGPLAAHRFPCSRCERTAGEIRLVAADAAFDIVRASFTSELTRRMNASSFERVRRAVEAGDAATLYAMDAEFTPFFCPDCAACYCGAHWLRQDVFDDDGWHDSIRGTCPEGHERMLED